MAKKGRKRIIRKTWTRRRRLINGRYRFVWVRRLPDGTYETRMTRPEIHGMARAKQIHARRKIHAKAVDKGKKAKDRRPPTDENLRKYGKKPGTFDIKAKDYTV